MPICKCGKQVDDWRGARGHVQFTAGDGHGAHGDVPDDWKSLFDEDDGDDPDDQGATDDDVQEAVDDVEADEGNPESSPVDAGQEATGDRSEATPDDDGGRLWKALTDDVRHLWGGA